MTVVGVADDRTRPTTVGDHEGREDPKAALD